MFRTSTNPLKSPLPALKTATQRLTGLSSHFSRPPSHTLTTTSSAKMPLVTPNMSSSSKPRVILGLMTFGPPGTEAKGARISTLDEYNNNLDYFQSQGYNEVDTARAYIAGAQEGFTREAKWQDRGLTLATKCYPVKLGDHSPEKLRRSLEKSLEELGAKCVDIFYLHAPDRGTSFKDTIRCCDELFKEGKFVNLGLSNFAAWEVAEVWNIANENGWVKPTIYQAMYNAITRDLEKELIPACRKYSIDLVIYNPLAGGVFSGKYKSKSDMPSEGRFGKEASTGKMYRERYFQDNTFQALQHIEPVVQKHNLTLLETALRWCVHHSMLKFTKDGGNDGVIIGVSSLKQLEGNLTDLEKGPLPDEVVQVLDEAWETYLKGRGPSYWR